MSKSNIVFKLEYKVPANKKSGITGWIGYAMQKDKADSSNIDGYNVLDDFVLNNDNEYYTQESDESFLWNSKGDLSRKDALLKIKDMQDKGIFWRGFISFPIDFALEHGLITKLDYYSLTINVMPKLIMDMGLDIMNTEWMCTLHNDTPKHPHIHFCIFEIKTTKTSPKYNKSIIYRFKSNVANYLINNEDFYVLRDRTFTSITGNISRKELNKVKAQRLFSDSYRKELNKLLFNLYNNLPPTGRLQYNAKNMKPFKKDIDQIIEHILLHDSIKYDYANYLRLLKTHQKELNEVYGQSSTIDKDKYYNDQVNRLYSKIGNEILQNFKIYQSLDIMKKEKEYLKKYIQELNFKSRNDYAKIETKEAIAKELYKLCNMAGLNNIQRKKVFTRWIQKSGYNFNVDEILVKASKDNNSDSMSTTEYYKALNRLGYSYERYTKIKNKNFYRELNYKRFFNKAVDHLMYELEKEEKAIINDMKYDLGELI